MASPDRKTPSYPLFPVDMGPIREERTAAITGEDASVDEAEYGDAGNGADVWSDDLIGGVKPLEDYGDGEDIQPDEVRRFARESDEEEVELTAQPNELPPRDPTDNS